MSIIRVRTVLTGWTGGPGLSTMYFRGAGASPTQADINDVGARVRAFWAAVAGTLAVGVGAQVQSGVEVVAESTGILETFGEVAPVPAVVVGTAAGDFYAPGVVANLRFETGISRNGRRVRGRAYIGPLSEGVVASGILLAANATQLATAGSGLIASTPTTSRLVVWSQPRVGVPGAITNVSSFVAPTKLAHLRSRRD